MHSLGQLSIVIMSTRAKISNYQWKKSGGVRNRVTVNI